MADDKDIVKEQESLSDLMNLIDGKAKTEAKLGIIRKLTAKRLARLLHEDEVPETFDDVLQEVTLKRFRRLGNEGMTAYQEAGESLSFPDSDFDEYAGEIASYREDNGNGTAHGAGVWFA